MFNQKNNTPYESVGHSTEGVYTGQLKHSNAGKIVSIVLGVILLGGGVYAAVEYTPVGSVLSSDPYEVLAESIDAYNTLESQSTRFTAVVTVDASSMIASAEEELGSMQEEVSSSTASGTAVLFERRMELIQPFLTTLKQDGDAIRVSFVSESVTNYKEGEDHRMRSINTFKTPLFSATAEQRSVGKSLYMQLQDVDIEGLKPLFENSLFFSAESVGAMVVMVTNTWLEFDRAGFSELLPVTVELPEDLEQDKAEIEKLEQDLTDLFVETRPLMLDDKSKLFSSLYTYHVEINTEGLREFVIGAQELGENSGIEGAEDLFSMLEGVDESLEEALATAEDLSIILQINKKTKYIEYIGISGSAEMIPAKEGQERVMADVRIDLEVFDHNKPVEVDAPTGPTVDLYELLGMAMGSSMESGMMGVADTSFDFGSNANTVDSDGDGLSDWEEEFYGTDPNNPDSDEDGYNDKVEIDSGYNPLGLGKLDDVPETSNLGSTRNNATVERDMKRFSAMKQLQTALELYYVLNNSYPLAQNPIVLGSSAAACLNGEAGFTTISCQDTVLFDQIPSDPGTGTYVYQSTDGTSYIITAALEGGVGGLRAGNIRTTPTGITNY